MSYERVPDVSRDSSRRATRPLDQPVASASCVRGTAVLGEGVEQRTVLRGEGEQRAVRGGGRAGRQSLFLLGGEVSAVAGPAGRVRVAERMDEQIDAHVENGRGPGKLLEQHVRARGVER